MTAVKRGGIIKVMAGWQPGLEPKDWDGLDILSDEPFPPVQFGPELSKEDLATRGKVLATRLRQIIDGDFSEVAVEEPVFDAPDDTVIAIDETSLTRRLWLGSGERPRESQNFDKGGPTIETPYSAWWLEHQATGVGFGVNVATIPEAGVVRRRKAYWGVVMTTTSGERIVSKSIFGGARTDPSRGLTIATGVAARFGTAPLPLEVATVHAESLPAPADFAVNSLRRITALHIIYPGAQAAL